MELYHAENNYALNLVLCNLTEIRHQAYSHDVQGNFYRIYDHLTNQYVMVKMDSLNYRRYRRSVSELKLMTCKYSTTISSTVYSGEVYNYFQYAGDKHINRIKQEHPEYFI